MLGGLCSTCVLAVVLADAGPRWLIVAIGMPVLTAAVIVRIVIIRLAERSARERGQEVTTVLVQAPVSLFFPGWLAWPAQVLLHFGPEPPDRVTFLLDLAARLVALKQQVRHSPAEAQVVAELLDETYRPGRRFRLPVELTEGHEVYLASVMVHRDALPPDGFLTNRLLNCRALPGPRGRVVVSPPVIGPSE